MKVVADAEIAFFTESEICVASRVRIAATFASRFFGLLNRRSLDTEEGLLLEPGGAIHTVGMRISIDAVFLDEQRFIVKIVERLPPWCFVPAPAQTRWVLELACGRAASVGLREGMPLIERRNSETNPTVQMR